MFNIEKYGAGTISTKYATNTLKHRKIMSEWTFRIQIF